MADEILTPKFSLKTLLDQQMCQRAGIGNEPLRHACNWRWVVALVWKSLLTHLSMLVIPSVQTPVQALQTLKRSKGMDGIVMVSEEGDVFLVWHNVLAPPKDAGQRLQMWVRAWQTEVGVAQRLLLNRDVLPNV